MDEAKTRGFDFSGETGCLRNSTRGSFRRDACSNFPSPRLEGERRKETNDDWIRFEAAESPGPIASSARNKRTAGVQPTHLRNVHNRFMSF